jgi:hypothetical protein
MSQASTLPVTFSRPPGTAHSVVAALLPIIAAVFVAYLVIGLAMPVLPLHVHEGLGLSTFVVGLVAGSQFAAALLSRPWAGYYADSPALGLVASGAGLGAVFLVSTLVVTCSAAMAVRLLKAPSLDMASRSQDYEQ